MANKYQVMVEAVLDKANIQGQINQLQQAVKSAGGGSRGYSQDIDAAQKRNKLIEDYNTKLNKTQILNKDAFASPDVQAALANFNTSLESFKTGANNVGELDTNWKKLSASVEISNAGINGFAHEIGIAIQRTIEWALAMGLLYGSLKQIQEGIQYIKDLNVELTDAAIVGGYSQAQVANLAKEYNALARELGVTTIEVAKGNLEWVN